MPTASKAKGFTDGTGNTVDDYSLYDTNGNMTKTTTKISRPLPTIN